MVVGVAARPLGRPEQGVVARLVAAIYARLIAPGAGIIVLSGLFLTMTYMGSINRGELELAISPWIMAMQGLGLIGAAVVFAVALPGINKLARLDPVAHADAFDALRTRQRLAGMIASTCAFVSLLAGAMYR